MLSGVAHLPTNATVELGYSPIVESNEHSQDADPKRPLPKLEVQLRICPQTIMELFFGTNSGSYKSNSD